MATSYIAAGSSVCWARIVLAILGEMGGCEESASAKACASWQDGGGTSSTELSQSMIGGGMRMGEPVQGDSTDGS